MLNNNERHAGFRLHVAEKELKGFQPSGRCTDADNVRWFLGRCLFFDWIVLMLCHGLSLKE